VTGDEQKQTVQCLQSTDLTTGYDINADFSCHQTSNRWLLQCKDNISVTLYHTNNLNLR